MVVHFEGRSLRVIIIMHLSRFRGIVGYSLLYVYVMCGRVALFFYILYLLIHGVKSHFLD